MIERITIREMTKQVTLGDEETQLLKKVIIEQYKKGEYERTKRKDIGYSIMLAVTTQNTRLPIGYIPETKQLYFDSFWFSSEKLKGSELGEFIFKTDDMLLTIDDEIDEILIEYKF